MKGSNFEKFFQNFTAAISKPIPARAGVRGHWQCNGSCDPAPDIFTQLTGDPVICPDVARPRDILLAPVQRVSNIHMSCSGVSVVSIQRFVITGKAPTRLSTRRKP